MALARGSLRAPASRRLKRPLRLAPDETVPEGLRRMAVEQADVALAQLAGAEDGRAPAAVHEARKSIKRLRTIVRLLEGELGEQVCAREQAALRAAAERLAAARDAEVMLATLDTLVARHPRKLAGRAGIARLHAQLEAERAAAERRMLAPANRMRAADELRVFRTRAAGWELAPKPGIGAIEDGLGRIYRQGRKRGKRAAGRRGGRMRTMHQWRKRVKDLRYAAEALRRAEPSGGARAKLPRKRRRRAGEGQRWIRDLARSADELGELLGEEHDLAVFGAWLSQHGSAAGAGRGTRRRLRKHIVRRRRKLRRRALRGRKRLYTRKPPAFVRRAARAFEAGTTGEAGGAAGPS